jgi:hypothetical protein
VEAKGKQNKAKQKTQGHESKRITSEVEGGGRISKSKRYEYDKG